MTRSATMTDDTREIRTYEQEGADGLAPEVTELLLQCYGDMRVLARKLLAGNVLARQFQPTELANEVAIRLIRAKLQNVSNEGHFLALAARTMRQLLIDHARKLAAEKRQQPVFLTIWPQAEGPNLIDISVLNEALKALAEISAIRAQVVELRFMLGMTVKETAIAVKLSDRTVNRHWLEARAWLIDHVRATEVDSFG